MKKTLFLSLLSIFLYPFFASAKMEIDSNSIKVMQYNLYAWNTMAVNKNAKGITAKIYEEQPDFITVQEASAGGYTLYNYGINSGDYTLADSLKGGVGIYYRPSHWRLIPNSFVEFPLPSRDEWNIRDHNLRVLLGGLFERKTDGKQIYVYATHWSLCGNGSHPACRNSISIREDAITVISALEHRPNPEISAIVGGDLNIHHFVGGKAIENSEPLRLLQEYFFDSYRIIHPDIDYKPGYTFGNHDRIDYLFLRNGTNSPLSILYSEVKNGSPSDHQYLVSEFIFLSN